MKPKHIHVIGICGVLTSALAIALHKRGWRVTGSDKGFFPPVSTYLTEAGVPYYAGWHVDKMIADGAPDLVVIATASGTQNPETAYVREHGIPEATAPEIFRDYFIKPQSIVCVGTWGKTSSTALLSFILLQAGLDPSYMFGGISLSHDAAAKIGDGQWSVFEGDEYKSSPTDPTAKFFFYKPTHLLLTAVSWDHADLYPTEQSYFDTFKKLVAMIPANGPTAGKIVACIDQEGTQKILGDAKSDGRVITYGKSADAQYRYDNVTQSQDGITLSVHHDGQTYEIHSPLLGAFQAENITGCFAMAHSIGIDTEKIIKALGDFQGIKRRLEKRLDGSASKNGVTVIDDIAHSAEKAHSVIKNLHEIYPGKLTIIFEPNIGGRERDAAEKYDHAFDGADEVIIPRLTKLKIAAEDANDEKAPMEGDELAAVIAKTHSNTHFVDEDKALVAHLLTDNNKGDCIAFLGSHGFRGMIEEVVASLKK